MLEIDGIAAAYGNIEALRGVDLSVEEGGITCLLGPNGAGKTTLMMTIAGILKPRRGTISFLDRNITGMTPSGVVRRGIALVPENRLVFPDMNVHENLVAGAYLQAGQEQGAGAAGHRARLCPVPQAAGTLEADGGHAIRRRAADVGRRPCPDGAAEALDDGRAVARPGTSRRRGDFPDHQRSQRGRHHDLPGRAERAHGACRWPTTSSCWSRDRWTFSGKPGQLSEHEVIQRAYLGKGPQRNRAAQDQGPPRRDDTPERLRPMAGPPTAMREEAGG